MALGECGVDRMVRVVAFARYVDRGRPAPIGTAVSADSLADQLELSLRALCTMLGRLRRVLGFASLVSAPPGYELRVDAVDARDFERRLAVAAVAERPVASRRDPVGLGRRRSLAGQRVCAAGHRRRPRRAVGDRTGSDTMSRPARELGPIV